MAQVVWHHYFDNSPRCDCYAKSFSNPKYKCPNHNDPYKHGAIEWLRFVWAVNKLLKQNAPADFDFNTDDAIRELGGFGGPIALYGTSKNPANIKDSSTGETWRGVEKYDNFTIYTNAQTHRALIECTNPKLVDICNKAMLMVGIEMGTLLSEGVEVG